MDRYDLPQEAVSINGQYIEDVLPGYKTVTTTGREGLTPELNTYTVGTADGETVKGSRYPVREIVVEFLLMGESLEDYRDKVENLANLLSLDEADYVFNDEADRFYTGRALLQSEVTKYKNGARGQYIIRCSYPFKRSVELITLSSTDAAGVVVSNNTATFTFGYGGTQPARPLLRASFAAPKEGGDYNEDGDCGYVAFMDTNENIIQLGNPDVIDVDQANKNVAQINSEFTELTGWTHENVNIGTIQDQYWNRGTGQTLSFAIPSGTAGLSRSLTNATNYDVNLVQRLCVNNNAQTGGFSCLTKSGSRVLVGYTITKTGSGTSGLVNYIVDDKIVGTDTIDLSLYNTNFGYCNRTAVYTTYQEKVKVKTKKKKNKKKKKKYKTVTRTKVDHYNYTQSDLNAGFSRDDDVVTFFVAAGLPDRTYKSTAIVGVPATSIEFSFTGNLYRNALHSVDLVGKAGVPFAEIPNVFTANDIVEADCNTANVVLRRAGTIEGSLAPMYGALGNDWEDFEIKPGENVIRASWSEWVDPAYKPLIQIIYNEVYV